MFGNGAFAFDHRAIGQSKLTEKRSMLRGDGASQLGHMRQPILSRRVVLIGKTDQTSDRCSLSQFERPLACATDVRYEPCQTTSDQ